MFFQKVLKGVCFDDDNRARSMLFGNGIVCNWWSNVNPLPAHEISYRLTERNLLWHLSHYNTPDPDAGGEIFSHHTPYISTTAGSVERDVLNGRNIIHAPFPTALSFATNGYSATGYIFYGHLYTLGKQSIELSAFAEEVRELNIYKMFLPYQTEGEIAAKIQIPSHCLERYEKYDAASVNSAFASGVDPLPIQIELNPNYANPDDYCNIKGLLS